MIGYVTALLMSVAAGTALAQVQLEAPRFAAADLDGDGTVEVVVGGRSGPYREGVEARGELQIGGLQGGRIVAQVRAELPVVRDVAVGDVLGEGRPDIVTVGGGRLTLHGYASGEITEKATQRLQSDWTDRVALLANGPQRIVAVTEYTILPDADVGETTVRGFAVDGNGFREIWSFHLKAHVGDLTFLDDGDRVHLVLETGAGEEGGDVLVYALKGTAVPAVVWSVRLTDGSRCLSMEAVEAGRHVILNTLDGARSMFRFEHSRLVRPVLLSRSAGQITVPVTGPLPGTAPAVLHRDASGWSIRRTAR